ncbi:substrate-binding periplasmic protein [Wielerella bovis]|uniref:substrate-binding periplasmic protein n=1 Tax=Wielerella bovis TaxID=2917790 RepID=UPI00201944AB|nr:transporter substrate-binding domain-containing protein [Wielerella bovis]ULJ67556.1 transporter substrate-binding domain-containing protein [Wielerella bovis]
MTKSWILAPMVAVVLSACGGGESQPVASNTPATTTSENGVTYRVAIEETYPPFVQSCPTCPNGAEGFDIDLLNAIAQKEGFQLTYKPVLWEGIFDLPENGGTDIIAGGLSVTDERKTKVDFTDSYYETSTVLAVPQSSSIQSFADAKGKKVAYQVNTSMVDTLRNKVGEPAKDLGFDNAWLTIKSVMAKQSDAAIGHSGSFHYFVTQYKDEGLRLVYDDTLPKEPSAFAIKKGNTELLEKLNRGLAAVKADGTWDKLKDKWLGDKPHVHSDSESHTH